MQLISGLRLDKSGAKGCVQSAELEKHEKLPFSQRGSVQALFQDGWPVVSLVPTIWKRLN